MADDVAVNLCIHFGGSIVRSLERSEYVGGESRELGQFDVDTLSFAAMC